MPASHTQDFVAVSHLTAETLDRYGNGAHSSDAHADLERFLQTRHVEAATIPAVKEIVEGVSNDLNRYHELKQVPPENVRNFRNDM